MPQRRGSGDYATTGEATITLDQLMSGAQMKPVLLDLSKEMLEQLRRLAATTQQRPETEAVRLLEEAIRPDRGDLAEGSGPPGRVRTGLRLELPVDLVGRLQARADGNHRSIAAEAAWLLQAMLRHQAGTMANPASRSPKVD